MPTRPNGKPFEFLSFDELRRLKDHEFLIPGLLPTECVAMLFGPSGAYKTFVALSLLLSIATGTPWMQGTRVKRSTVMYVFGEGGAGLKKRAQAWFLHHNKVGAYANVTFHKGAVNLFDKAEVLAFIEAVQEQQAANRSHCRRRTRAPLRVIAFDTLARCMVGAEENSNSEMSKVMDHCDMIRDQLGVTVLLVHHTGKTDSNEPRGASAMRGAMDSLVLADRPGRRQKFKAIVSVSKMKDDEEPEPMAVKLEPVDLPNGQTSLVAVYDGVVTNGPANDNETLSPNQQAIYDIVVAAGVQGIAWPDVRAQARSNGIGGNRSSALAEYRNALLKKALIVEQDGRLYAAEHAAGDHGAETGTG